MGFFDRLTSKKTTPAASDTPVASPQPFADAVPRLAAARAKLEAKDLPGALAIYEELLAVAGERADVLVAISGDLGAHGHVAQIIELVAPRYDADRHGPATRRSTCSTFSLHLTGRSSSSGSTGFPTPSPS